MSNGFRDEDFNNSSLGFFCSFSVAQSGLSTSGVDDVFAGQRETVPESGADIESDAASEESEVFSMAGWLSEEDSSNVSGRKRKRGELLSSREGDVFADKGEAAPELGGDVKSVVKSRKSDIFPMTHRSPRKKFPNFLGRQKKSCTSLSRSRRMIYVFADTGEAAPEGSYKGQMIGDRKVVTKKVYQYHYQLVFMDTGKAAPKGSHEGQVIDGREIVTKYAYHRNRRLVLADTGEAAPKGSHEGQVIGNRKIVTKSTYLYHHQLVFMDTGEVAPEGSYKGQMIGDRKVVAKYTYRKHQLVFADTGEAAPEGSYKGQMIGDRKVVAKYTYLNCQLVLADTGEVAPEGSYKGQMIEGREVVTQNTYRLRQLVFADTGEVAPKGSHKGQVIGGREIVTSTAYHSRQLRGAKRQSISGSKESSVTPFFIKEMKDFKIILTPVRE